MRAAKLIALLLPDSMQNASNEHIDMDSATALMCDDDGRMSLQPLTQEMTRDMPFKEQAMTTGCFKRGKPIFDPSTREVIGYEMEMISGPEARLASARLQLSH